MIRAALFGSIFLKCVCEHIDRAMLTTALYAPKMSLAALASDPVRPELTLESSIDPFTRKVLQRDIENTFPQEIRDTQANLIIVDFMDDYYPIFSTTDRKTTITGSNYINKSSILGDMVSGWDRLDRDTEAAWQLWRKGCARLRQSLDQMPGPRPRIIALRIRRPERFRENGSISRYDDARIDQIRQINKTINICHDIFAQELDCDTIDVPDDIIWSTLPERNSFNPQNINVEAYRYAASAILERMNMRSALLPSLEEKFERLLDAAGSMVRDGDVPTISELHAMGVTFRDSGDMKKAQIMERMIMLLRNSSVPLSVKMDKVSFGYGGIGVIIHAKCRIGNHVKIGSNVTLGAGRRTQTPDGIFRQAPDIEGRSYIATGAKILGGITIGHHTIIGANAVVTRDVAPLSVVAGNPGRVINTITPENLVHYASYLYKGMKRDDVARILFPEKT